MVLGQSRLTFLILGFLICKSGLLTLALQGWPGQQSQSLWMLYRCPGRLTRDRLMFSPWRLLLYNYRTTLGRWATEEMSVEHREHELRL